MARLIKLTAFLAAALHIGICNAAATQDVESIRATVEAFLSSHIDGNTANVRIEVSEIANSHQFAKCDTLQAFFPPGAKAWGYTSVGIKCDGPTPWSMFVRARVKVVGNYLIAAHSLTPGQIITMEDLSTLEGDLATLPSGTLTDPDQAIGSTLRNPVSAGQPLRSPYLKIIPAVQAGQIVRLIYKGPGFKVSNQGRALNSAHPGQVAQVRLDNGQVISGTAQAGAIVEISP